MIRRSRSPSIWLTVGLLGTRDEIFTLAQEQPDRLAAFRDAGRERTEARHPRDAADGAVEPR